MFTEIKTNYSKGIKLNWIFCPKVIINRSWENNSTRLTNKEHIALYYKALYSVRQRCIVISDVYECSKYQFTVINLCFIIK